jgi:hypothetical protein
LAIAAAVRLIPTSTDQQRRPGRHRRPDPDEHAEARRPPRVHERDERATSAVRQPVGPQPDEQGARDQQVDDERDPQTPADGPGIVRSGSRTSPPSVATRA